MKSYTYLHAIGLVFLYSCVGLGRFIDISMHRDMKCTDTRIDMLGAVSRYFLKIEQQNLIYAEPQNKSYYF